MQLTEQLRRIHDLNFAGDYGPFSTEYFESYLAEDGFEKDEDVPEWFRRMIELVDRRLEGSAKFEGDNGSMGRLLQELHHTHGWDVDDYGEGVEMVFPGSKMRVFISREARGPDGRACDSYAVSIESGATPADSDLFQAE
jgi:hypothetical protein